jgi:hypothetical protein
MVDHISTESNINKSLSADAELNSAYDYLRSGQYKLCKRTIDKKFPKLKSELDKVNFNIVKILLFNKMKKIKDSKKLIEQVTKQVLESPSLSSNQDLCNYFKNVLRELNEESAANEIFKNSIKNYNLSKIPRTDQFMIMKELTLNYEFSELYSKVNAFLKNENDPDTKFLTLLKYEVIYILAFKLEKLSKVIVNLTLKEMINNYEKLKSEKGFIDILVKFLLGMGDYTTFLNFFEEKNIEFTNAPMDDLLIEIYYKKDDGVKLVNFLINSIRKNLHEWNYAHYQRLVNFLFSHFEKKGELNKIDTEKILGNLSQFNLSDQEKNKEFFDNFKFEDINADINTIFTELLIFFSTIHSTVADKKINFNAYKSALLVKLTFLHNLVLANESAYKLCSREIYKILSEILDNSVTKQSILIEVSKFFIYLDENMRKEILSRFLTNNETNAELSENEKEKIIFYYKLEKMLMLSPSLSNTSILSEKISNLSNLYFSITKNSNKLEKGERILGDDLIILINEYFFGFINESNNKNNESSLSNEEFIKLSYAVYSLNAVASERSPYNYDISLFFLRSAAYLNLPAKVFEILKFMNLKGPQFETVSYIAFPVFFNNFYKPGLQYLIDSFERWESNNKKSIRKTFWKMFTGRNFWSTEELLLFLNENDNSYYKHVLSFLDTMLAFNDNYTFSYEDESVRMENFGDITEALLSSYSKFEKQLNNNKLTKNQDLVISIFKFKQVPNVTDVNLMRKNKNYSENDFKYKIDSLWKNNIIHENYPGFKSNFLRQNDIQVLDSFDSEAFLDLRSLNKILFSSIALNRTDLMKETLLKYNNAITKENSFRFNEYEKINKNLLDIYVKSIGNVDNINKEEESIDKYYGELKENYLVQSEKLRNNFSANILNFANQKNFTSQYQAFRFFYLPNFTLLTSKFVDLVSDNKKSFKDAAALKSKFLNHFKVPFMNYFVDTATNLETTFKSLNSRDIVEYFLKSINSFVQNENLTSYSHIVEDLGARFHDEQKEILKGIVDVSKSYKNFVKDNI